MPKYNEEVLKDKPILYYRMEEASGNPQDSSGNARHGTHVGAPTLAQPGGGYYGGGGSPAATIGGSGGGGSGYLASTVTNGTITNDIKVGPGQEYISLNIRGNYVPQIML